MKPDRLHLETRIFGGTEEPELIFEFSELIKRILVSVVDALFFFFFQEALYIMT